MKLKSRKLEVIKDNFILFQEKKNFFNCSINISLIRKRLFETIKRQIEFKTAKFQLQFQCRLQLQDIIIIHIFSDVTIEGHLL